MAESILAVRSKSAVLPNFPTDVSNYMVYDRKWHYVVTLFNPTHVVVTMAESERETGAQTEAQRES